MPEVTDDLGRFVPAGWYGGWDWYDGCTGQWLTTVVGVIDGHRFKLTAPMEVGADAWR